MGICRCPDPHLTPCFRWSGEHRARDGKDLVEQQQSLCLLRRGRGGEKTGRNEARVRTTRTAAEANAKSGKRTWASLPRGSTSAGCVVLRRNAAERVTSCVFCQSLTFFLSPPSLLLTHNLRPVYDLFHALSTRNAPGLCSQLERRRSCVSRFTANTLCSSLFCEDAPESATHEGHRKLVV